VVKLAQAQIKELAESYQPDIFWFDGTWAQMGNWTKDDAWHNSTGFGEEPA